MAAEKHEWESCFTDAASRYSLDPDILRAIAVTESAMDPTRHNASNRNGSVDLGIMQINSYWYPFLEAYGIKPADLWDACTNIFVGAWVLAQNVRTYGKNWLAVGAYNATSREKRYNYARLVYENYRRITGR